MSLKNSFALPDAALVTTCFFWGLNAVITKSAVGDVPETFRVFIYNGLRVPAGALLLILTVKLSDGSPVIKWHHIRYMASLAFFGMFMFMVSYILGISMTSSANTGIITATTPLFILAISFISGIEHPTTRMVTGISVGFCGMIALTFKKGGISLNIGDFLILCSSLFWAIHTVYGKKMLTFYSPLVTTVWVYLFTSLYQLPLVFSQLPNQTFSAVSPMNWFYLSVSTVCSIFLANSLYYYSINKIGPSRAGVYTNLTPVFTLILAVIIRGETISPLQIIGLLVIISGIAITKSDSRAQALR